MLVKKASPQNRVLTYYNYDNAGRQLQILARDADPISLDTQ